MQDKTENRLSPDLWYLIFGQRLLDKQELGWLSITCRLFHEIMKRNESILFKNAPCPRDGKHDIFFPVSKRTPLLKLQEEDPAIDAETFVSGNA